MKLHGRDALAFHETLKRCNAKIRAEALAEAKAATKGKEPFNLDALERLCDTSNEGRLDPVERRREKFEYMYYVQHPEFMTLAELAEFVEELNKW